MTTDSGTRTVALEEAFLHPRVWELFPEALQQKYQPVRARLRDVGPGELLRIAPVATARAEVGWLEGDAPFGICSISCRPPPPFDGMGRPARFHSGSSAGAMR